MERIETPSDQFASIYTNTILIPIARFLDDYPDFDKAKAVPILESMNSFLLKLEESLVNKKISRWECAVHLNRLLSIIISHSDPDAEISKTLNTNILPLEQIIEILLKVESERFKDIMVGILVNSSSHLKENLISNLLF